MYTDEDMLLNEVMLGEAVMAILKEDGVLSEEKIVTRLLEMSHRNDLSALRRAACLRAIGIIDKKNVSTGSWCVNTSHSYLALLYQHDDNKGAH